MRKRGILILILMMMISFVGCSKDVAKTGKLVVETENLVAEKVNNKYLYYTITDDRWDNEKYAYGVEKTFIFALNNEKSTLYAIRNDGEECLKLIDTKIGEDGYGVDYTFKSNSEDEYKLNVLLNKDNKDDIKFTLHDPNGNTHLIEEGMLTKEECEDRIKSSINEVELGNMIATNFKNDSNLDLDKIKTDIDNAREKIYEKTKESKDEVHYIYSPSGSYCDEEDNDFKLKNYVFVGVYLDENGEMMTINDFAFLVDANDFNLYQYTPNGTRTEYKEQSYESVDSNNEVSNDNIANDTANDSMPNDPDKKGKYSEDEIIKILRDEGHEQVGIIDGPIYYNNEWCYLVAYMSNPETYRMVNVYIGSDTLTYYSYEEVN